MLQGYTLTHLFVPGFFGMDGADVSRLDGGNTANINLTNYTSNLLTECDALYVDYDENLTDLTLYKEAINAAKNIDIKVVLSHKLARELNEEPNSWPCGNPLTENPDNDRLYRIKIPIITVLAHNVRVDQFAVELALRKYFIHLGYKVGQIGSTDLGCLFGIHTMPDFLYEPRDMYEKIIRFNHHVRNLVNTEQPELLIIGVPDPIMKYNHRILHGLGTVPYVICNGVQSDLHVMCTHYNKYKTPFFDELSLHCKYRLGSPVEFFSIANVSLVTDANATEPDKPKLKYLGLSNEFVQHGIQDIDAGNYDLFNVLNDNLLKNACDAIHEALTDNVCLML